MGVKTAIAMLGKLVQTVFSLSGIALAFMLPLMPFLCSSRVSSIDELLIQLLYNLIM